MPEDGRRALKARAASRGQSLNSFLLDVIAREAACPTVDEVLARAAERAERATVSSAELIEVARRERTERLDQRAGA